MAEHELNKIVDVDGEVFNLRDSTKQPVADKVTSWSSTTTDTHYPSEKLVKDALDGKVPGTTLAVSVPASSTRYVKMTVPSAYHHYLVFFNASMGVLHAEWLFRTYGSGGISRTVVNYIGAPVTERKWYVAGADGLDFYIEFVNASASAQYLNFNVCALDISTLPSLSVVDTLPSGYSDMTISGTVAEKMRVARNLAVDLANTTTNTSFDGSGNVTNIKTTGVLGVANGGTGNSSVDTEPTASSTKMVTSGGIKTALDNKIPFDYSLLDTNPFGGKHLYLNYICNAMYSMDYRYFVTVTRHKKVVDGVEYPRIKPGASVTDDVYYEDSPIVATVTSIRTLFNGDYEGYVNIPAGEYLKVHIQFSNEENWTPATGRVSDYSYNYGTYYLSFYHANIPDSAQWRCYNTYAQHTVGWKQGTFGYFAGDASSANSVILSATDNGNHKRTCIEFIVFAKESTATGLSQIDWKLQRPTLSRTFPFFTNFADQNSYVNWYFKEKVNSNPKITLSVADGNVKATTFEGKFKTARKLAVSLSNTATDTSFDGSADVTNIKTTGTLAIANGGTGATTKKAAEYAINGGMAQATAAMADNFQIVFSRVGSDQSATNGVFIYRTAVTVWNYIKSKLSSDSGVNISGNAATATDLATNSILSVSKGGTGKSSVTSNSFLVGNGTSALVEKTPAEVLSLIGAQGAMTEMTTQEVTDFINDLGDL